MNDENPPERIYLQIDPDDEEKPSERLNGISWADATWCADRIGKSDLEYKLVKRPKKRS